MNRTVVAYIAIGSNLGDRHGNLTDALAQLGAIDGVEVSCASTFHETEPVGPPGQGLFLNAAAELRTTHPPMKLLQSMLDVEQRMGRCRNPGERWGPRIIDLDLLLYSNEIINAPGLVVPHPHMQTRLFVLNPLCEIAAQIVHPVLGQSIESLRLAAEGRESAGKVAQRE